jgi:hypothetical protein
MSQEYSIINGRLHRLVEMHQVKNSSIVAPRYEVCDGEEEYEYFANRKIKAWDEANIEW